MLLRPVRDPARQIVDFECTYANPAVQRMLGPAAAQLRHPRVGRLLELLPWAVELAPFVEVIETGESKVLQQLEVSRITTGKIALRREPVEIGSILTQALEGARPLMESRNHQVEVALPYEPMQVDGDPMRLTQVLLNILNNAAKYTPEHGNIRLQAGREGNRIVLRVRDNGYGISPE
jgi:signal transduction histidine kinase